MTLERSVIVSTIISVSVTPRTASSAKVVPADMETVTTTINASRLGEMFEMLRTC